MPREIKPAIRRSRVLEKIRAGKIAYSVKLNVSGQEATEIAAMSGFDCIWSCTEHCPTTLETVKAQAAVCKAHDTDLLVRVPRGGYSEYIRPLEQMQQSTVQAAQSGWDNQYAAQQFPQDGASYYENQERMAQ